MAIIVLMIRYLGMTAIGICVLAGIITTIIGGGKLIYAYPLAAAIIGGILLSFYLYIHHKVKTKRINIDKEVEEIDIAIHLIICFIILMALGLFGISHVIEHGKDIFIL